MRCVLCGSKNLSWHQSQHAVICGSCNHIQRPPQEMQAEFLAAHATLLKTVGEKVAELRAAGGNVAAIDAMLAHPEHNSPTRSTLAILNELLERLPALLEDAKKAPQPALPAVQQEAPAPAAPASGQDPIFENLAQALQSLNLRLEPLEEARQNSVPIGAHPVIRDITSQIQAVSAEVQAGNKATTDTLTAILERLGALEARPTFDGAALVSRFEALEGSRSARAKKD